MKEWEAKKQDKIELQDEKKSTSGSIIGDTFTLKLLTKIVDNVQLEISNVHIRIEDETLEKGQPYVAGITIEKISGTTTDKDWNNKWIENSTIIHKLLQLSNLSVYWNPNDPFLKFKTTEEAAKLLDNLIKKQTNNPTHKYILNPVNATLQLKINKQIEDTSTARISAHLQIPQFSLSFQELQYKNIANLLEQWSLYQRSVKYRYIRPRVPLNSNKKLWWQFAGNAIIQEIRNKKQQWTWDYISLRTKYRKQYVDLYRKLNVGIKLTDSELSTYDKIEQSLNYDDLILYVYFYIYFILKFKINFEL